MRPPAITTSIYTYKRAKYHVMSFNETRVCSAKVVQGIVRSLVRHDILENVEFVPEDGVITLYVKIPKGMKTRKMGNWRTQTTNIIKTMLIAKQYDRLDTALAELRSEVAERVTTRRRHLKVA